MLSEDVPVPAHNVSVLTIAQVIKNVMSSAAEAELASLFTIAKEMIPLRQALTEMGWPQSATPIQCDNSTAVGVCQRNNNSSEDKIHGYELPLATLQRITTIIQFFWAAGKLNLGDYSTKDHPPMYHLAYRHTHAG